VRITFSERQVGDDLAEFFRRSDCAVEHVGQHALEITPRLPLLDAAAKLEIEGLLRVWCKLHPESSAAVTLVGGVDGASDIDSLVFRKPS
jgi:hypothetical protein